MANIEFARFWNEIKRAFFYFVWDFSNFKLTDDLANSSKWCLHYPSTPYNNNNEESFTVNCNIISNALLLDRAADDYIGCDSNNILYIIISYCWNFQNRSRAFGVFGFRVYIYIYVYRYNIIDFIETTFLRRLYDMTAVSVFVCHM